MEIKLVINLALSLIGVLIYYLIRRVEINRAFKKDFLEELASIMKIQRIVFRYITLVTLSVYHIIRFINSKIDIFVNGKNYEKHVSHSETCILTKSKMELLISRGENFIKKAEEKLSYEYIEEYKKSCNSVSNMLINEKSKKNDNVMIATFMWLIVEYWIYFSINLNMQHIIFVFFNVQIWLVVVYQILITYRNKKGYYGTNYDEAKEIIYFIKKISSDDINISGGKKILNEIEEQVPATNGQEVTV